MAGRGDCGLVIAVRARRRADAASFARRAADGSCAHGRASTWPFRVAPRRRRRHAARGARLASWPGRWPRPRRCSVLVRAGDAAPPRRDPPHAAAARRPRAAGPGDRTIDDQRRRRHPPRADARGREDHRPDRRHADRAAAFVRARHARRRDLGEVRVLQPGRLGQGPRRLPDDPRRDPRRAARPRARPSSTRPAATPASRIR